MLTVILKPRYTIQPVVKAVVKPLWQPVVSCTQTFNLLSNRVWQSVERTVAVRSTRLSNRFDNRLDVCLHDTAGCQNKPVVSCKRGIKNCITTVWWFVNWPWGSCCYRLVHRRTFHCTKCRNRTINRANVPMTLQWCIQNLGRGPSRGLGDDYPVGSGATSR